MKALALPVVLAASLLALACESQDAGAARELRAVTSAASNTIRGGEEVTFSTSDGVVIAGTIYQTSAKAAPAILCLHQWRSDRTSFTSLAVSLNKTGFTVLTIDMRGYGGSTKKTDGSTVRPDRNARPDIKAALEYLQGLGSVDKRRIGILGASYGSSNAIIHSSQDASIKAVALLSPGLNYFNVLPTAAAVKQYGSRPLLAIASSEDLRSVEAIDKYREITSGNLRTKIVENAGHGTNMLGTGSGVEALIEEFFGKNL